MIAESNKTTPKPITTPTIIFTFLLDSSVRELKLGALGFGISVMVDVASADVFTVDSSEEVGTVDVTAGVDVYLHREGGQ